ncbi:MAG TPA: replication protein P [Cellvibrionaceae bacterium]
MSTNSPTAAGPNNSGRPLGGKTSPELIDAINQVFALFRRNYLNQYHKAFGDVEELNHTKRLWLEILTRFTPQAILLGARGVIENSEYLPSLHTMIRYCEQADSTTAFPDPHSAYSEACRAPSPKAAFTWSHLAVYYAGKACDWYFLQTHSEALAFPVFKEKYLDLCAKIRAGLMLAPPAVQVAAALEVVPTDKKEALEKLAAIRAKLEL